MAWQAAHRLGARPRGDRRPHRGACPGPPADGRPRGAARRGAAARGPRRAAPGRRAAARRPPPGCALDLRIHTNGVQLSERFCDLFAELDIKVGISLDGDRAANDRHRRYADGRSSHAKVLAAVELLRRPAYRHLYAGLLCTMDVENDPVAVYDALVELAPPRIDFLLPHATWDDPPKRPSGAGPAPYADWLLAIHRRWTAQGRPVPVRIFDSVHRTLRGRSSLTESLGLDPADLVVVETDGTLEQADSLKTAYDGAPETGFDVFAHTLDEVAGHPGMMERQSGLAGLSADCRSCPVVRSCGGGLYAHRYRSGRGFDNPSVFCGDLMKLITTIRDRVAPATTVPAQPGPSEGALTEAQLAELATGHGSAATVRALASAQLGLTRRMLAALSAAAPEPWSLLAELDTTAPDALDAALGHPYVRAWAVRCLDRDPGADLGGFAELAAAAALRARREFELPVPVRGGAVHLPTLGRVEVGGAGEAVLRGTPDGFTVRDVTVGWDDPGGGAWQPVRRVALPGWTLALEDTDPQRDSHQWPVTDRLTDGELLAWTGSLREAWELLGRDLPEHAAGLRAGLSTVTPLRPGPAGRDVSAAARQAFGAVGIARPGTAPILALLLAHEFNHVKLGAVLDFHDLYDPADDRLFHAPWRPDPRPLEGLLQGTYAHLAVTEFWATRVHAYAGLDSPAATHARTQHTTWHTHTATAIETLAESGSLTPLGTRFTEIMRSTIDHPGARGSADERLRRGATPTSENVIRA
ncbi:FxsB family cyclophane-forming radical SAM/SPASM peptide maturase [Kitasatospora gansuensis]